MPQNVQIVEEVRTSSLSGVDAVRREESGRREGLFTIGEMSRDFGITLRALRFYEDRGLLTPRREGSSRFYSEADRKQLTLLLLCKRVGMSIIDIGEMLALDHQARNAAGGRHHQIAIRDRFSRQLALLIERKDEVEKAIAELSGHIAGLDGDLVVKGT